MRCDRRVVDWKQARSCGFCENGEPCGYIREKQHLLHENLARAETYLLVAAGACPAVRRRFVELYEEIPPHARELGSALGAAVVGGRVGGDGRIAHKRCASGPHLPRRCCLSRLHRALVWRSPSTGLISAKAMQRPSRARWGGTSGSRTGAPAGARLFIAPSEDRPGDSAMASNAPPVHVVLPTPIYPVPPRMEPRPLPPHDGCPNCYRGRPIPYFDRRAFLELTPGYAESVVRAAAVECPVVASAIGEYLADIRARHGILRIT
eukprot:tig00000385_g24762.t1